jgi:putative ABC transport system ATP-binding protein
MLELKNVSKSFEGPAGEVKALDDVSCTAGSGELVAVHGPSGCGKTTLLLAAGGLLRPDAGQVCVAGVNPYTLTPDRRSALRAARIGFVFQRFHLVPYLSVLENVLAPSVGAKGKEAHRRARQLLFRFAIEHRAHHMPGQLSVGEQQRAALARAMLNEPDLLLADEPTGNLDDTNAHTVLTFLDDFARGGGAVLLVTHDRRAMEYAARSVYLEGGKTVAAPSSSVETVEPSPPAPRIVAMESTRRDRSRERAIPESP